MLHVVNFNLCRTIGLLAILICGVQSSVAAPAVLENHSQYHTLRYDKLSMRINSGHSDYRLRIWYYDNQALIDTVKFFCHLPDNSSVSEEKAKLIKNHPVETAKNSFKWVVDYQWPNFDAERIVETGDFPGIKVTYRYKVTKEFNSRRLALEVILPRTLYNYTGYMTESVMQMQKVQKAQWFGILRSKNFPFITFGGEGKYGLLIMAGDRNTWKQLPVTLLYSTSAQNFHSVTFTYCINKDLKVGDKGEFSFYFIPVSGSSSMVDAMKIYAQIGGNIK